AVVGSGQPGLSTAAQRAGTRRLTDFWRLYARSTGAVVGALILLALIVMTITAHWIEPYDPIGVEPRAARQAPRREPWFGTDQYGRDVLSRVIDGAHISLEMGLAAVFISVVFGTIMGLIAGYNEGIVDSLIMRFVDMLLAFPGILLALAIVAALGPSLTNVI